MNRRSVVINLGALEFVGVVDVDGFPLREEVDGGDGGFAVAVAGLLGAAEGEMRFGPDSGRVHIDDAGVKVPHRGKGAIDVARIDGRGEAVRHAVGDFDSLLKTINRNERNHGTKDFFLGDAHFELAIAEDRWLVEPSFSEIAAGKAVAPG